MMRTFQQACVGFILASMGITSANAGISIDSTRVIFEASDHARGQSVGVSSTDSSTSPYLIKAQVTRDIEGKHAQTPFVTTPSLFRLEPGSTHQVLIVKKQARTSYPWIGNRFSISAVLPCLRVKNRRPFPHRSWADRFR
uniref:fimbrial biogenesis chaperone n=1 Tax=Pectobacterium carotovorum TaxID=554 RepID=UPI003003E692